MAKAFSVFGMVVSIIFLLVFGLDLFMPMIGLAQVAPFGRASWIADVGFIICGLLLGYMSWSTYREQT